MESGSGSASGLASPSGAALEWDLAPVWDSESGSVSPSGAESAWDLASESVSPSGVALEWETPKS